MKLRALAGVAIGAAAFVLGGSASQPLGVASAYAQSEGVRPELGKHLKAAGDLLKAGKFKEALAKVREAEAVGNRNATENFTLEGMRVAAASGAADAESMVKGFEGQKATGKLGQTQQIQIMEAIAGTYLRANNAGKALEWANKCAAAGGNSPTLKQIQQQAQFKSGDMSAVMKDTLAEVQAEEKAGKVPSQDKLNLVLYAAQKKGDVATEAAMVDKLLNYYPRKELWAQVLGGLSQRKGFSPRFGLDVYRLKFATGNLRTADDFMEFAQLAAQAGYPEEGKKVVDQGLQAGILGQGAEAGRHKRLQDLLSKKIGEAKAAQAQAENDARAAKEGDALVKLGLAMSFRGEAAAGIKMIEEGLSKGNLKRPEDAKLYLGLAQFVGGDAAKAQTSWRGVKGGEGAADLARLWSVHARSSKN